MAIPNVVDVIVDFSTTDDDISIVCDLPDGERFLHVLAFHPLDGLLELNSRTPADWTIIYSGWPEDTEQEFFGLVIAISTTSTPDTTWFKTWHTPGVFTEASWITIGFDSEVSLLDFEMDNGTNNGGNWEYPEAPILSLSEQALVVAYRAAEGRFETWFPSSPNFEGIYDSASAGSHASLMVGWYSQESAGDTEELIFGVDWGSVWAYSVGTLALITSEDPPPSSAIKARVDNETVDILNVAMRIDNATVPITGISIRQDNATVPIWTV